MDSACAGCRAVASQVADGCYMAWLAVIDAAESRVWLIVPDDPPMHCEHWMDGDEACCRCGEPNWCPDEGESPAALKQFEYRKVCPNRTR